MPRYIVNPGNAVHSVEEGEFKRLTLLPGYREATPAEIAGWYEMQGLPVPSEIFPQDSTETTTDVDESNNQNTIPISDTPTGSSRNRSRAPRRSNGV